MGDNNLRALAKAYFEGKSDIETYIIQRTQLIDKIIKEYRFDNSQSTLSAKSVIVGIMLLIVVEGALYIFFVL